MIISSYIPFYPDNLCFLYSLSVQGSYWAIWSHLGWNWLGRPAWRNVWSLLYLPWPLWVSSIYLISEHSMYKGPTPTLLCEALITKKTQSWFRCLSLSLCQVMSGSGDLDVLRMVRRLRLSHWSKAEIALPTSTLEGYLVLVRVTTQTSDMCSNVCLTHSLLSILLLCFANLFWFVYLTLCSAAACIILPPVHL